jgi:hypothetical protein
MSNFTLLFDSQADDATLTTGSWTTVRPLDNLKDYRLSKKARSSNLLVASTKFRFALASSAYIQAVGLMATNLSPTATWKLVVYDDATFTTWNYDSGPLSHCAAGSMPNSQIPTGAPNAGTGQPTHAELLRFQNNAVHMLGSNSRYGQYCGIEITDTSNTHGYVEVGRLFVGQAFTPTKNTGYGEVELALATRSDFMRARDGTPYFTTQRPDFSIPFGLSWLTKDEAMRALDIQRIADITGEVGVVWDSADVEYWWRRQVFGNLKNLDPIKHPRYATYAAAFQVEGTL